MFRRAFVLRHLFDLRKLGDAVHQSRDFRPEIRLDIVDRCQRVFDRVVQQSSDDRFLIKLQVGHQAGHFDGMREIRIARRALLRAVFLHGVDIGAIQHRLIGGRVVILDLLYKFVLAQH